MGFAIYSLNPYRLHIRRTFAEGVRAIQMIGKSNLVLIVPMGREANNNYKNDCVLLWDDQTLK